MSLLKLQARHSTVARQLSVGTRRQSPPHLMATVFFFLHFSPLYTVQCADESTYSICISYTGPLWWGACASRSGGGGGGLCIVGTVELENRRFLSWKTSRGIYTYIEKIYIYVMCTRTGDGATTKIYLIVITIDIVYSIYTVIFDEGKKL